MAFKKVRAGCLAAGRTEVRAPRPSPRSRRNGEGLAVLVVTLKRPMNQLVNEAVQDFVDRRSREVEHDLEATLTKLRAYRQRDPHFVQAIAAIADAEARVGKNDPAEGTVVIGNLAADNWLTSARSNQPVPCRQTFAGC